ncbi:uncharacterized protein PV09_03205 [Verruconis gallopava]|uniref:Rhodopsin domain-containing protein n=1 Tax=Verruconis gallopava TaxID=253628 RepID=A0A0D1XTJ5_9PEZI|nr:uncharacterized protein PV09_03205 [Verruconis gallopava]KIW06026.1 hypothetical protein PV09_03205 [Verruconis gallopava]
MEAGNVPSAGLQIRSIFQYTPAVLASYPPPNYVNPAKRGPLLYILNSIFFTCMITCVTLRFYARLFVRKWFGPDDVFILCAVVGAIGVTAVVMLGFHEYGWNLHVYDIPPTKFAGAAQVLFASKILWSFTSNSVRASVTCLYYRLLTHVGTVQHRWILHANSAFILLLFLTQQITVVFACWPISLNWTIPFTAKGECFDNGMALFTTAVLNTLSEAIVAALPLPIILSLNLSRRQRRITIGMLCGGFVVVIVGCVRVYYLWVLLVTHDPSWWSQPHWICSEVEMDVAIICACVPAITPVLRRVFKGGWHAAKRVNPSFSMARSDLCAHHARSLFSRLKDHNSLTGLSESTSRSNRSRRSNQALSLRHEIDLEGISNDGYGYSVTITTGRGTKVKRRWNIRNRTWHYYPEEPVSEAEDERSSVQDFRKKTMVSRTNSKGEIIESEHDTRNSGKQTIEVRTETAFDVRESFHSEKFDRGFDFRNPYRSAMPGKHEEDIEIALQLPAAEASDWSLFDGEVNRLMSARLLPEESDLRNNMDSQMQDIPSSPVLPESARSRQRTSPYESRQYFGRHKRRSLDSFGPQSSSTRGSQGHRVSHSDHDAHPGGPLSQGTANLERDVKLHSALRALVSPRPTPSLPPPAQIRKATVVRALSIWNQPNPPKELVREEVAIDPA